MRSTFNFNRPYVRDKWKTFTPLYVPGENYSLYINFYDVPPSQTAEMLLYVIDANTQLQVAEIGVLTKLYVAGSTGYHLYIDNFVFPYLRNGEYYFQVFSSGRGGGYEQARSNLIEVNGQCFETTSYVEFRHNDELYNVRYDLLPDFWQKFRLPINQINAPDISSTRDSYRESSEQRDLEVSKSFRDIKQTLEISWCNELDIEAMSAVLEHREVKINGSKLILLEQLKVELPSFASEQMKATFPIIVKDDEPALLYSAEGALCGGTTIGYICENFFIGNS